MFGPIHLGAIDRRGGAIDFLWSTYFIFSGSYLDPIIIILVCWAAPV